MTAFSCGLLTLCCIAAPLAPHEAVLKVVSYNIHHAEGMDGVVDLDRIVAVIRQTDPDVVCLQEVDRNLSRTGRLDFPSLFAEKLSMQAVFEANYRFDGGEYGNATLTRLPVVEHRNMALPNPVNAEPRGCLAVTVEWQGRKIAVFNAHLGLNGQERLAQAEAIAAALGSGPTLLMGDMNENAFAPGMQHLLAGLQDAGAVRADSAPYASAANRIIDYVLYCTAFEVLDWSRVSNELTRMASDHLPVAATFRLRPVAAAEADASASTEE